MARNLASRLRMIVNAPQIIAVRHRRECSVKRENLQTMSWQIEFANDLRTQERNDVRANRKLESGKDFFRYRGAAEHMPAFEYQHTLTCAREICSVDQAIVAAADDDRIVF